MMIDEPTSLNELMDIDVLSLQHGGRMWEWFSPTLVSGRKVQTASIEYLNILDDGTATYEQINQPETDVGL